MTKLAKTYDIESIMHFIKSRSNTGRINNEESLYEYRATIFEHILREEATIDIKDNKIVGINLLS